MIRNYLKKIGYKFSTAEASFIVWQSRCHSMAEKHEAWLYIIDNLPDEEKINIAIAPVYWESSKKVSRNFGHRAEACGFRNEKSFRMKGEV